MKNQEKQNEQETVSMEAFNNVVNVLKETAEIIGLKTEDEEFSLDLMRNVPPQVRKIKESGTKIEQKHEKYKIFVEESLKAKIKHLDDAYTLANSEIDKTEMNEDSPKKIKVIIDELKESRPFLFHEENFNDVHLPVDFISSGEEGSMIEILRKKALQSGSPQDLQKYWSARRQIR